MFNYNELTGFCYRMKRRHFRPFALNFVNTIPNSLTVTITQYGISQHPKNFIQLDLNRTSHTRITLKFYEV